MGLALLKLAVVALFELLVLFDVVDAEDAVEDLGAVEVVDGEDGRLLVLVHEEGEPSRFVVFFGPGHVDVGDLVGGSRVSLL